MVSASIFLKEAFQKGMQIGDFVEKPNLSFVKDPFYIISTAFLVSTVLIVFFSPLSPFSGKPAENTPSNPAENIGAGYAGIAEADSIAEGLLAGPATEEELFELIMCPCCGAPISQSCCGAAIERQNYVKGMIDAGVSKKGILLAAAKKYGLESILDEAVQDEITAELIRNAPEDRPIIVIEPSSIDFGDVSVAGREVYRSFVLRNDGKSSLTVTGMDSSCGCTTAALVLDGVESPRFGMAGHGLETPADWSVILPPGKEAELRVYYNPQIHPDLRGPVTRTITVFSDDPVNFGEKVRIEANQVD